MAPRRRASTLKGSNEEVEELQGWLNGLLLAPQSKDDANWLQRRLEVAHHIRQRLLDGSRGGHPKDAFRHIGGFRILLDAVADVLGHDIRHDAANLEYTLLRDLLQVYFGILTAALRDHGGNRRYFQQKVNGNGWSSLRCVLTQSLYQGPSRPEKCRNLLLEYVLASLLACAVGDDTASRLFTHARPRRSAEDASPSSIQRASVYAESSRTISKQELDVGRDAAALNKILDHDLGRSVTVSNPEAFYLMFELWKLSRKHHASDDLTPSLNSEEFLKLINYVINASTNNLTALHTTDLLGSVLASLIERTLPSTYEVTELQKLAINLLSIGIGKLDHAHFLFRNAKSSPLIAELLLTSLKSSQIPSYIHFDLLLHGFSSIELPGIGRAFPPMSTSGGYTLSLWFQIVKFDQNSHTTLFGAFDSSQSCFVLVYLEKDTHHLILQTSIRSSRPSVRFKAAVFSQGNWYHLALTHRRPRTTSSSRASLFVNGEFVEQVKSQYPVVPPPETEGNRISTLSGMRKSVQAFVGTPQDLALQVGANRVSTQWRLSSVQLFSEVLSDDLLAVHYELGARYTGNFQDCLGSFQTYQASAKLNLRNESLHPGKEERSDIVSAIRSKAGDLLPEDKVLINISAENVFQDRDLSHTNETQLLQSLSRTAYRNLYNVTRGGRNALAINGAYPAINEALLHKSGYAILTGDPTIVVPGSLDNATWRVGGCAAICLGLLEAARNADEVIRSLNILFVSIRNEWRNSEAMEKENGFGVLANLITIKLEKFIPLHTSGESDTLADGAALSADLCLVVMNLLLEFVGYCASKPDESVINNPLAYRILLVDLDIWRTCVPTVQKAYYEQFVVFASKSKYHQFNNKRLSRMRKAPVELCTLRLH